MVHEQVKAIFVFLVSLTSMALIEFLKELPGMVTGWTQLIIGVLTIVYLIKKIRKK